MTKDKPLSLIEIVAKIKQAEQEKQELHKLMIAKNKEIKNLNQILMTNTKQAPEPRRQEPRETLASHRRHLLGEVLLMGVERHQDV